MSLDRRMRAIYRQVPDAGCKGLCQDYCGPLAAFAPELRVLSERSGLRLAVGSHATGGDCPLLHDGKCSQYTDRPLVCRLWGATDALPCPHGCRAARPLSAAEADALMAGMGALEGARR